MTTRKITLMVTIRTKGTDCMQDIGNDEGCRFLNRDNSHCKLFCEGVEEREAVTGFMLSHYRRCPTCLTAKWGEDSHG